MDESLITFKIMDLLNGRRDEKLIYRVFHSDLYMDFGYKIIDQINFASLVYLNIFVNLNIMYELFSSSLGYT